MDYQQDKLTISISADVSDAEKGIASLISSLERFNDMVKGLSDSTELSKVFDTLSGIASIDFSNVAEGLEKVAAAYKNVYKASSGMQENAAQNTELERAQLINSADFAYNIPDFKEQIEVAQEVEMATNEIADNLGFIKEQASELEGSTKKLETETKNAAKNVKEQKGWWEKTAKTIKKMVLYRVIRELFNAVLTNLKNSFNTLYEMSEKLGTSFAPAVDQLKSSFVYLANSILAAFAPIVENLGPIISQLIDISARLVNVIAKLMASFLGSKYITQANKTLEKFNKTAQKTTQLDLDELNVLGDTSDTSNAFSFEETEEQASGLIGILQKVADTINNLFDNAQFNALLENTFSLISSILDVINTSGIDKVLASVVNLTNDIAGLTAKLIGNITPLIKGILSLLTPIFDIVSDIIDALDRILVPLINTILDVLTPVWDIAGRLFSIIGKILEILVALLNTVLAPVAEILGTIFELIGDILGPILELVEETLQPVFDYIEENLGWVIDLVKGFATTIVNVIKLVVEPIKAIVRTLVAIFTLNFGEIGNIWSDMCNNMGKIWEKVWKGIGNFFIGIINGVITGFEGFINLFVKAINGITKGISSLWTWLGIPPVPKIPLVKLGRIPALSTGGLVEDGLFMANHGELIGGFAGGKTAVANNEQITTGIYEAVRDALQDAGFGSEGEKTTEVNVYLDSKKIAKQVKTVEKEGGVAIYKGATNYAG